MHDVAADRSLGSGLRGRVLRKEPDRVILAVPVGKAEVLVQVMRQGELLVATAMLGWPESALREAARAYRDRGMQALVNRGCCFLRVRIGSMASLVQDVDALAKASLEIMRATDFTPIMRDVFAHFLD